ncbi:MAG: hypothetical protein HY848_09195 [Betaproteobacteria bacterium]|nr:hypothetical protein [Betaproteobacteria bacterium]
MPRDILAANRASAEAAIAAFTGKAFPALTVDPTAADALYVWAGQANDELAAAKHRCPKLMIAQVLGFTSDPKWLIGVALPAAQAQPRHRVIARLTREECWQSIWTFNWDCHIELALESIGLKEQEKVEDQPWPMRFQRVLTLRDYGKAPQNRTIVIHKRHGCIKNINDLETRDIDGKATADDYVNFRFRITKVELTEELDKTSADYKSFCGQIVSAFAGHPLAVFGWSASEKYLLDEFENCAEQLQKYPDPVGRLSIVDPLYNPDGHSRLSAIYAVTKEQSHFPIAPAPGEPDQDNLFLWIQTLYALAVIHRTLDDHKVLQEWLTTVIEGIKVDVRPSWITYWVDVFLPAWVQLCWRTGLVTASLGGRKLRPEQIMLEGEEWYVPLRQDLPERPELISAAYLLKALSDSADTYRFDLVSGTLYLDSGAQVVLPLPAWGDPSHTNMLNSVPRVVARIKTARGFANRVTLLAMPIDGTPVLDHTKGAVKAAYLLVAKLRSDADITVVGLEEI